MQGFTFVWQAYGGTVAEAVATLRSVAGLATALVVPYCTRHQVQALQQETANLAHTLTSLKISGSVSHETAEAVATLAAGLRHAELELSCTSREHKAARRILRSLPMCRRISISGVSTPDDLAELQHHASHLVSLQLDSCPSQLPLVTHCFGTHC